MSFVLVCLTIISGVMAVFAPISFFFLLTTTNYEFFKLVNILIFAVSGFVGIHIFYKNLSLVIAENVEEANRKRVILFLKLWLLMFGFIGAQLSYSLSPFFGDPSVDFMIFNENNNDFFSDVIMSFMRMLG